MANNKIILRNLNEYDWDVIEENFKMEGWQSYLEAYQSYFEYMKQGICEIIIAQWQEDFAGIIVVNWQPEYTNFREREIPEISDMRVIHRFMRSSVDNELMDEAEKRIFAKKETAGIGVPIIAEYGLTQVYCIRRGYMPDGRGIYQENRQIETGQQIIVDERLKVFLVKKCDKATIYKKNLVHRLINMYYNIYKGKK